MTMNMTMFNHLHTMNDFLDDVDDEAISQQQRQRPRRRPAIREEEEQEQQPLPPLRAGTVVTLEQLLQREWSLTRVDIAMRNGSLSHMQGRLAFRVNKEVV